MSKSWNLNTMRAILFTEDMMKFCMHHHGIQYRFTVQPSPLWQYVTDRFHDDLGIVIMGLAKSTEKEEILSMAGHFVRNVLTWQRFSIFISSFSKMYFEKYGYGVVAIFKYLAYIIEYSILAFLRGITQAPLLAVEVIVKLFECAREGTFIQHDGLTRLNQIASEYLTAYPWVKESFTSGTLDW